MNSSSPWIWDLGLMSKVCTSTVQHWNPVECQVHCIKRKKKKKKVLTLPDSLMLWFTNELF